MQRLPSLSKMWVPPSPVSFLLLKWRQCPLDSPREYSHVTGCEFIHHKYNLKCAHPWAFWPLPRNFCISTLFQKPYANPDVKEQSQWTLRLALQVLDIILSPESQVKIPISINLVFYSTPSSKTLEIFSTRVLPFPASTYEIDLTIPLQILKKLSWQKIYQDQELVMENWGKSMVTGTENKVESWWQEKEDARAEVSQILHSGEETSNICHYLEVTFQSSHTKLTLANVLISLVPTNAFSAISLSRSPFHLNQVQD